MVSLGSFAAAARRQVGTALGPVNRAQLCEDQVGCGGGPGVCILLCLACAAYAVPWTTAMQEARASRRFNRLWQARVLMEVIGALWLGPPPPPPQPQPGRHRHTVHSVSLLLCMSALLDHSRHSGDASQPPVLAGLRLATATDAEWR